MGCDTESGFWSDTALGFNPRTRMGCDIAARRTFAIDRGFNPRTRMGCDYTDGPTKKAFMVSIHAPAWGATAIL